MSDKIVKVGGSSTAIATPGRVTLHYDLSSADMIREAFLHLPDTFKERVELLKCVRAELVEGTTQKGTKIECAEALEALGLVYSFGPSETWRPTMLGIYAARSIVGSHAELTRPGASSEPSMVARLTLEEIARNERRWKTTEERTADGGIRRVTSEVYERDQALRRKAKAKASKPKTSKTKRIAPKPTPKALGPKKR